MFPTFNIVKELCKKQGISINQLEERIGFSKNSLYSWKNGEPKPSKLYAVAEYFNVSTDYLLGRTNNPNIVMTDGHSTLDDKMINLRTVTDTIMFDGIRLGKDDLDFMISVLEAHFKSKKK